MCQPETKPPRFIPRAAATEDEAIAALENQAAEKRHGKTRSEKRPQGRRAPARGSVCAANGDGKRGARSALFASGTRSELAGFCIQGKPANASAKLFCFARSENGGLFVQPSADTQFTRRVRLCVLLAYPLAGGRLVFFAFFTRKTINKL